MSRYYIAGEGLVGEGDDLELLLGGDELIFADFGALITEPHKKTKEDGRGSCLGEHRLRDCDIRFGKRGRDIETRRTF